MLPYGRQDVTEADIEAVIAVLRSPFLTQGPVVPRFEEALSSAVGASHAVAVNSATSALHLACLALGVGPGDHVWTSAVTFVASANCARYCGADVDFVDVDPATGNMSVEALADQLTRSRNAGRLPKVVIPVHLTGRPCEMGAIGELAREFGFRVIEDASHAVGAVSQGDAVGACPHSDIVVFSFHPVKIITTAEGGAAVTNDAALAERMVLLRSHGITRDPEKMVGEPHGPWYYEQLELGFNYRLTEMQAALGLSQLERLDEYVARREALVARYDALLAGLPIDVPPAIRSGDRSAHHLYVVRVHKERRRVFDALRADGIGVNVHYIPVPSQPYYAPPSAITPHAAAYYEGAISLPLFPLMTEGEQDLVRASLEGAVAG